jgi:MauM/NapG family ferredoxin protein
MKLSSFRYWRTFIPLCMLIFTVFLLVRHTYPLPPDSELLLWYSRLDPLLLLSFLRWEGQFPIWGILPLGIIILTLIVGRVFCGWFCPVGGLLTLQHNMIASTKKMSSHYKGEKLRNWMSHLYPYRYPWLLFLLVLMMSGSGWVMYLSPFHLITEELSRILQQKTPWMLLLILSLGMITFPRFWCVFICPSGLIFSLLSRLRMFVVNAPKDCRYCGICQNVCPTGSISPKPSTAGPDCLVCGRCSEHCPAGSFVLSWRSQDKQRFSGADKLFTRRESLRIGSALAIAIATLPSLLRPAEANPLRPPGALEEDEFLARCSRCGRCIKTCPSKCLKEMPLSSGPALFLTPMIVPREARCELTQDCQKVCPTGAISHLPVKKAIIGLAEIDHSRCIGWAEGKLCLICQEQCPQQAVDADPQNRPSVVTERCVGCGACENACPVEGPAIVVRPQLLRRRF